MSESRPQDGDIVIAHEMTPSVQYTIRQVPGIAQFGTSSQGESLQLARRYAREHAVDVWCREHGTFRLLERCRLGTRDQMPGFHAGIAADRAGAEGGEDPARQQGWFG